MRKVLLRVLVGMLVTGLLSTASMAEDVCVTKHGKKYHKMGSRFIKDKEYEVITREEAEARGYKPSSDFFRDEAVNAASSQPTETNTVSVENKK